MSPVAVRGVGVVAPGLIGWEAALPVLRGAQPYAPEPLPKLKPDWLPANERRRLSRLMRLALPAGQEAVRNAGADPATLATVFASATGDGDIIHAICEELARPAPAVSPTQFHNSVHNAPAGYWSIAANAQACSTAVAAKDASFAAGLLEAVTTAEETGAPVLLVAYDQPLPFPLSETRRVADPFACALLLDPGDAASAARLVVHGVRDRGESTLADAELERLRACNPAARALPLLALLARGESGRVVAPYFSGGALALDLACG